MTTVTRRCTACKQTFPLDTDHFYRNRNETAGLTYECKKCHRAATDARDKANPAAAKQRNRKADAKRRQNNPDRMKTWAATNKDHIRSYRTNKKQQRLANNQCTTCGNTKLENVVCCEKCWYKTVARNHLKDPSRWEELKELAEQQQFICPYTGEQLAPGDNMSLDHRLPVSRFPELRYELSNMVWTTKLVNRAKERSTPEEFLKMCQQVVNYHALRRENGS